MHYYSHNIGDFNSATRHLTRVERALYRDLIELYYDTEQPLQSDDFDRLARRVLANSDEERTSLGYVLDEFFTNTGDGYRHARCDSEIDKYRANSTAKAKAGKASAEARRAKKQHNLTPVEQPLNTCATKQEPITNNHQPIKNTPPNPQGGVIAPEDSFMEFWNLYPKKSDKAKSKIAYSKAIKKTTHQILLQSLINQKVSGQWVSSQFTPLATTWLNGERWHDEIIPFSDPTNQPVKTNGYSEKQLNNQRKTAAVLDIQNTNW